MLQNSNKVRLCRVFPAVQLDNEFAGRLIHPDVTSLYIFHAAEDWNACLQGNTTTIPGLELFWKNFKVQEKRGPQLDSGESGAGRVGSAQDQPIRHPLDVEIRADLRQEL